jgi:multicomponent Na+:H+ antiporter subunit G
MTEWITAASLVVGSAFLLLAAVGVVRMPDVFTRMQAATKAASLGVATVLLGAAVHFGEVGITSRVLGTIVFVFLTTPVGAHMIARAAYLIGVPLWEGTVTDELRGQYDPRTHAPRSRPAAEPAEGAPR